MTKLIIRIVLVTALSSLAIASVAVPAQAGSGRAFTIH